MRVTPTTAGSPRCHGVGTDGSHCGRGDSAAPKGPILGGEKPKAASWGDSPSPHTAAPHHPDHPGAHGGAAWSRHRLGQQGEIQQEARAGGERGDGAGTWVSLWGHPSPHPSHPQLRTREGAEFLIQHDSEQIVTTWHRAIADSIVLMVRGGRAAASPRASPTPPTDPAAPQGSDVPTEEDAESGTEFGSREKLGGEERRAAGERRPDVPVGDAHPAPSHSTQPRRQRFQQSAQQTAQIPPAAADAAVPA